MDGSPSKTVKPLQQTPVANQWLIDKVLALLRPYVTEWPAVLPSRTGDPIKPLKIGIDRDLCALLRPEEADTGRTTVKRVLRKYCRSEGYIMALSAPGACRHDLAGTPLEPVSEKDAVPRRPIAVRKAPPPPPAQEPVTMTIQVKALKVTAVVPPDQLKPVPPGAEVVLAIEAGEAMTATARLNARSYRQALAAIAELGAGNVAVVVQGKMIKPGIIEAAGITVQPRKARETSPA